MIKQQKDILTSLNKITEFNWTFVPVTDSDIFCPIIIPDDVTKAEFSNWQKITGFNSGEYKTNDMEIPVKLGYYFFSQSQYFVFCQVGFNVNNGPINIKLISLELSDLDLAVQMMELLKESLENNFSQALHKFLILRRKSFLTTKHVNKFQ